MSLKYPRLVQDTVYPSMYRVEWEKGDVSDIVNKTRAKDAIHRFLETNARREREGAAEPQK